MKRQHLWGIGMAGMLAFGMAAAQAPDAGDYARAARMLPQAVNPLVDGALDAVRWQDADTVTWRIRQGGKWRFLRWTAAGGNPEPAFDHARLAQFLGAASASTLAADDLPVTRLILTADGGMELTAQGKRWRCTLTRRGGCAAIPAPAEPGVASPDGQFEAFIRDWNLWLREIATNGEIQLTTDGSPDYGYATDNAGWRRSDAPVLVWSPDSTKIATFRQDQRQTGEMVLIEPQVGHPKVQRWKYPLVGDDQVTLIERAIIDVPTRRTLWLDMPPDQHRSTLCDDITCNGGWEDVQWSQDSRQLAFASTSRDHKHTWLRLADATTGAVREVFAEHVDTWFDSGISAVSWRYLSSSGEILWYSQRSNWGHLYLYDAASGALRHAVTAGAWNVAEVLHVDLGQRRVWFTGVGREPGRNPYYRHLYSASLDGGDIKLLTPEDADHNVTLSPDARWFVDQHSTSTTAPVSGLRAADDGAQVAELAQADITRLAATGWVPPEPFTVTARDGVTNLYGLLFKPSTFDSSRRYPVVLYLYPGPQTGSVRTRSFLPAHGDNQALAELGFIVVALDGMGTPWRSKAFHAAWAGDIADNTLPDQITGLQQLAARYPWMDLQRVGIWGHSGGGNATAAAMFRYPEFFKVGVSQAGNHDNRIYEDDWAEKWQGLPVIAADGSSNYDAQANQNFAGQLQGKLLLIHGGLDDNVPPYATLLVVDALNRANRDYDLIWLPTSRHGFGTGDIGHYVIRRRWDYFVRWLLGSEPPPGIRLAPAP